MDQEWKSKKWIKACFADAILQHQLEPSFVHQTQRTFCRECCWNWKQAVERGLTSVVVAFYSLSSSLFFILYCYRCRYKQQPAFVNHCWYHDDVLHSLNKMEMIFRRSYPSIIHFSFFMGLALALSYGICCWFYLLCDLSKLRKRKANEINSVLWISTGIILILKLYCLSVLSNLFH